MKTAVSHIEQIKAFDANDMQRICTLLNWTIEQYCEHQFYTYIAFMKRRFHGKPVHQLNKVLYSKTMRGFWNNEWSKRNTSDFLPFAEDLDRYSQSYICPDRKLMICWDYSCYENYLIDEYMYCHCSTVLITDKEFLNRLDKTLKLI